MSIIKLEFSEDDAIAQKYLGEALVNMARHRETGEAVKQSPQPDIGESVTPLDVSEAVTPVESDTTSELPWDERIHSGNKTQNQDGSWKKRKKPKDMTVEQWDEFVADVETELTTLMSIPVAEPLDQTVETATVAMVADTSTECGTQDVTVSESEDTPKPPPVNHDSIVSADPAIDTVTIPKPPVINQDDQPAPPPPPVTDVAPVGNTPDVAEDAKPMTFVQLVQRMSAKCDGDVTKSAKIKDAIKAKYDVEFAALVKRPDLIPQIGAFLDTIEV